MAEPLLDCPSSWFRATLEPMPMMGIIAHVGTGSTPRTNIEDYWDGDIPWLTPKEISRTFNGIYVSHTERFITRVGLLSCSTKLYPPNTVMLAKRAPVGSVAINAIPMATNQGFLNFECGPRLDPLFFAYWLKINKSYLDQVANGSTYPELYPSDLFEFEIAIPSVEEQKRILKVVSAIQYVIAQGNAFEQSVTSVEELIKVQDQNRRLIRIRDIMLPLLFSGQLNISTVNLNGILETQYVV